MTSLPVAGGDAASASSLDDSRSRIINTSDDMPRTAQRRMAASEAGKRQRSSKSKSLYGCLPSCQFGPKGCVVQSQESILTLQDPSSQILKWRTPPKTVLIIKKIWDDVVDEPFVQLASWLVQTKKMDVYVESKVFDDELISRQCAFADIRDMLFTFNEDEDKLTGKIDLIICLGGDGTLLYASTLFQESMPPVMAFHLGSLGFLSPFEFLDYQEKVDDVLQEDPSVRLMLRTRLLCTIDRGQENCTVDQQKKHQILVLNEVVVDRGASPYLCQLDLYIQGRQVTLVQGDGLIISTPTGSTAYAASAGASIVHPNVPAIVIAPICPHSLSFRPIIIPAGVEVKVAVSPDARVDACAHFDGRQRHLMQKGDSLILNTSKYPLASVCHHDPVNDWFDSLAACLHWNVRKPQVPFSVSRASSEARESSSADSNGLGSPR